MTRKPWLILAITTLLLVMLAVLGWIASTEVGFLPPWVRWLKPNVYTWILVATGLAAVVQAVDKVVIVSRARKESIQRILDEFVREHLGNDPRSNRCTLFVAVHGWRAAFHSFTRVWWQDDRMPVWAQIMRLLWNPTQLYLYAYVRASRSNSDRSCVIWQVYHNKLQACEGVAGRVWAAGFYTVSVRTRPNAEDRRSLQRVGDLDVLPATHPMRRYAGETNVRDTRQLKHRNHLANYFVGQCVETRKGARWGVLLIDSVRDECPFPGGGYDVQFQRSLRTYAQILSTLLT